jgi:hypothetical protein
MSAPLISLYYDEGERISKDVPVVSLVEPQYPPPFHPVQTTRSHSQTSHTFNSNSSDRTTHSNSLSKMFTSPTRPLFSGYEHVVPPDADGLPLDENLRRGTEEWLQRQREKDLRQALRFEKAFDETRGVGVAVGVEGALSRDGKGVWPRG